MRIPDSLSFTVLKSGKIPEEVNWERDTSLENAEYGICALKGKLTSGPHLAQIQQIPQDEIRVFCDRAAVKTHENKIGLESKKGIKKHLR